MTEVINQLYFFSYDSIMSLCYQEHLLTGGIALCISVSIFNSLTYSSYTI
jgi:hypothetical protein